MTPKEPWSHICGILIFDFWFKKFWHKISAGLQKMSGGLQKLAGVHENITSCCRKGPCYQGFILLSPKDGQDIPGGSNLPVRVILLNCKCCLLHRQSFPVHKLECAHELIHQNSNSYASMYRQHFRKNLCNNFVLIESSISGMTCFAVANLPSETARYSWHKTE